jgi:hypothetical protein
MFFVAILEGILLGNSQRKEVYLVHSSGSWKSKIRGLTRHDDCMVEGQAEPCKRGGERVVQMLYTNLLSR